MKKIVLIIFGILVVFCFYGCGKDKNVSSDSSWKAFIGDNHGKTGTISAAPEVDANGNKISSSSYAVTKPSGAKTYSSPSPTVPKQTITTTSPKESLDKWLTGFKNCDWNQVALYSDVIGSSSDLSDNASITKYLFSKIKWSISQTSMNETEAQYSVTIKCPDILNSITNYIQAAQIIPDDENASTKIENDIKDLVNKAQMKETMINVTLNKVNSYWKVEVNDDLLNAASGNMADLYRDLLYQYFQEAQQ